MAADYQEGVCPPGWALNRASDLAGIAEPPSLSWERATSSYRALASHIWKHEEPPVDPAMDAVREAIAVYVDTIGYRRAADEVRSGDRMDAVHAALAALRNAGVLK
jgi:hypothetical protein